jgi:hypothetical protein
VKQAALIALLIAIGLNLCLFVWHHNPANMVIAIVCATFLLVLLVALGRSA